MVTDCIGTPIQAGSVIIYPGRSGSSMWMNAGVVQRVEQVEVKRYWDPKPISYPVLYIKRYDNRSEYVDGKRIEVPDIKQVKLSRVDRVTVLPGLTADDLRVRLYGEAVVDGEVQ